MSDETQSTTQDTGDLGEGGLSALRKERESRKALERELRAANERIAGFERRDLIADVVSSKGIDPRFANRLQGSTREELEADADALLELITPEKPAATSLPANRTEKLRGGGDPNVPPEPTAAQMADEILG